jgi:hypothetical protein
MPPDDFGKMLFVSASEKYGDKYIEHLLEQYKIYIGGIEKISDRRQKANEFFLALNAALVTVLGFVIEKQNQGDHIPIVTLASVAGLLICYLWYRMVRSYKGLNEGKFKIIHMIEARLPLALYDTEWEILGRGKDRRIYWPFTHIELLIPWIFIVIYLVLIVAMVFWHSFLH